MISSDNPVVQTLFRKYGPEWDPTVLADQLGADSAAGFAVDFRKYASSILMDEGLLARCPHLQTEFILVENAGVNGFAGKISDQEEHYIVGIFAGTITQLFEMFSQADYLRSLRGGLKELSSRSDWELRQFSLFFASLFLVYHEFGHVFRGHLNYSKSRDGSNAAWMEGQSETAPEAHEYTERRHLSECDADAFSGMLLGGEIQIHSRNIARDSGARIGPTRSDIMIIAATSIHFLFCLFDSKTRKTHPYYPPPHVRSAIVHAHIGTQLFSEGVDENTSMTAILGGLKRAEAVKKGLGMTGSDYDLEQEFGSWTALYKERLTNLGKDLVPFSPCNR